MSKKYDDDEIVQVVLDPKDTDKDASGVMAYFWREMLIKTGLGPKLELLINAESKRIFENMGVTSSNKKVKNNAGPSLMRDAKSTGMSIKVFFKLFTNVLRAYDINISISFKTVYTKDKTFVVSRSIALLGGSKDGEVDNGDDE